MAASWGGGRRREFPASVKAACLRRDRTCVYCGQHPSIIVDHRIPVAEGGLDTLDNAAGCCTPCHNAKTEQEKARGRSRASGKRPSEPHPGMLPMNTLTPARY